MKLEGHLDRCDRECIAGWVINHDRPSQKLQLTISDGDTVVATCVADRYRQDLEAGGLGDGSCSFLWEKGSQSISMTDGLRIAVDGTEYFFPPRIGRLTSGCTAAVLYAKVANKLVEARGPWRRFRKCILHIGTEKTGSTTLQTFLGLNREALETKGYFVAPLLAPATNAKVLKHECLAALSMAEDRYADDLRRKYQVVDRQSLDQFRASMFEQLVQDVSNAPAECETLLLSDEHCHSRLVTEEEAQNLKDLLDYFCHSYEVLVYLRPQHELAISQYGMFVANGLTDGEMLPPLPPPADYQKTVYTNRDYFDYEKLLQRWGAVFEVQNLRPQIFQRSQLVGGDVVTDFAATLSVDISELTIPEWQNTNISARAHQFLVDFHRAVDAQPNAGTVFLRERIRNAAQYCFPGRGAAPTRKEVEKFLEQFAYANEQVRTRWFPLKQHLFEVDWSIYPTEAASVPVNLEGLMDTFVKVLLADQELQFSLTPSAIDRLARGLPPTE